MPLTAVLDGRPIFIFDHDARALANIASLVRRRRQSLRCKDCAHAMTVVMPALRSWHFRHLSAAPVDCHYVIARESDAHRDLKGRIYDMCRARGWDAEVEWRVPGTNRRADVWARDELGRQFTFEVQLSVIPDDTAYDRSSDHLRAGLTPVWLIEGDLRSWAFPEGAKRVRIERRDGWALIGMGDPIQSEVVTTSVNDHLFMHARRARVLPLSKLLPLLDAPAPAPSPRRLHDQQRSHQADSRPRALTARVRQSPKPAKTQAIARANEPAARPLHDITAQPRPTTTRASASRRYQRNPDLPDHVNVIDRLRSLAGVLTDADVPDAARFERMRDLPRSHWTDRHIAVALKEVWEQRFWLWEHDWESGCGACGLPLDSVLIRRGYHLGCARTLLSCH